MYVSTLGLRSDQQTCECAAKLDVKAAFASLSAFSFPEMPTCEGIHAMTICRHLGLRWYLFKKVVKAFHVFSFKCFTPQAFDCGQAVGVNNTILKLW